MLTLYLSIITCSNKKDWNKTRIVGNDNYEKAILNKHMKFVHITNTNFFICVYFDISEIKIIKSPHVLPR